MDVSEIKWLSIWCTRYFKYIIFPYGAQGISLISSSLSLLPKSDPKNSHYHTRRFSLHNCPISLASVSSHSSLSASRFENVSISCFQIHRQLCRDFSSWRSQGFKDINWQKNGGVEIVYSRGGDGYFKVEKYKLTKS